MHPSNSPQRVALAAKLREYGSGWDLDRIEEHFTVEVRETPTEYHLTFTARGASGLWTTKQLGKQEGFSGRHLMLPEGPEASPGQLALVNEIFAATRTIWVVQANGAFTPIELSQGTRGLLGGRKLETRQRHGTAVLYMSPGAENSIGSIFVVAVDLAKRTVTEASSFELPPNDSRLVPPDEVKLIDGALRRHGDFGVYGNVTAGLASLAKTSNLSITRTERGYIVSVGPRDDHGHHLSFTIDAKTGAIDDVAAGHSVPANRVEVEDEHE